MREFYSEIQKKIKDEIIEKGNSLLEKVIEISKDSNMSKGRKS